jgi:hypothetical protein
MTALDRIVDFLQSQQGRAFCDDCLSTELRIRPRQAVQSKTSVLASDPRYRRTQMLCSRCRETKKLATRKQLAVAS